jgi:hypothetical protein
MKKVLVALGVLALGSCSVSNNNMQVEMANAELVKIDTIMRYDINRAGSSWKREQQLTWRDDYNNHYVSYASLDERFLVGTKMAVLRAK